MPIYSMVSKSAFIRQMNVFHEEGNIVDALGYVQSHIAAVRKVQHSSAHIRNSIIRLLNDVQRLCEPKKNDRIFQEALEIAHKLLLLNAAMEWALSLIQSGQYARAYHVLARMKDGISSLEDCQEKRDIENTFHEFAVEAGEALCALGQPLHAFSFYELADETHILLHDDLKEYFTDFATTYWNQHLPDCSDGQQFQAKGMPKILQIFQSLCRPDLLTSAGANLAEREADQFQNGHSVHPGEKGWTAHRLAAYKYALSVRSHKEEYALSEEDLGTIGSYCMHCGRFSVAFDAFYLLGDWENIENLACIRLNASRTNFAEAISFLNIAINHGYSLSKNETKEAIQHALYRLAQIEPIKERSSLHGRARPRIPHKRSYDRAKQQYAELSAILSQYFSGEPERDGV